MPTWTYVLGPKTSKKGDSLPGMHLFPWQTKFKFIEAKKWARFTSSSDDHSRGGGSGDNAVGHEIMPTPTLVIIVSNALLFYLLLLDD